MTILSSEIVLYQALNNTATTANGGRRSTNLIASGAVNGLFPFILPEDRVAGARHLRKIFPSINNSASETLYGAGIYMDAPTPGADYCTMFAGTQRDTMADHATATTRWGVGMLAANVSAGATTIVLNVENTAIASQLYRNGEQIVITDRTNPTLASSGNRDIRTITGTPSVSGTQVTIQITTGITYGYTTANNTRVASVLALGDMACSLSNWSESGTGTYDEATYPVLLANLGTVEQTWTITFTDATTFSCVGDTVAGVGSGTIGSNFAPVNPSSGVAYFTLRAAGHGGTHSAGDTITFQTHPACGLTVPAAYLDWVIPAGSAAAANNRFSLVTLGYTA